MEIKIKKEEGNELTAKFVEEGREVDFDYIKFIDWLYKSDSKKPVVSFGNGVTDDEKIKINSLLTTIEEKAKPSNSPAENNTKQDGEVSLGTK